MDTLKKLYIEPTSRCNLDCKMCFRNTWFAEPLCDLSFADYQNVLDHLPDSVETLFFGGMGEPLVHPDILQMVKLAAQRVAHVALLTNGTLLQDDMILHLIDRGLGTLWISIDELDAPSSSSAGHKKTDTVIKNMQRFHQIRQRQGSKIRLGVAFVAMKSNVAALSKLPDLIATYAVDEVNISNLFPSDREAQKESLYDRIVSMKMGTEKTVRPRPVVNMPYMDLGIGEAAKGIVGMMKKMNYLLYVNDVPVFRRSKYCRFIEEGMAFIRSDGDVSPCMALLHNGTTVLGDTNRTVYHHAFGNTKTQTLHSIWSSQEYRQFRAKFETFSFSPCMYCGHCQLAESNEEDCFGNERPTCGGCLWAEGVLSCP